MKSLYANPRFYVLAFSVIFSMLVYLWVMLTVPSGTIQIIKLTQTFGLTALVYLYLALLAGPLCFTFRRLPFRGIYLKARRALGVSAFYFGLLHGTTAFFFQLGGFAGLGYLSERYLVAITQSATALFILALMTATSFDAVIAKMTYPKWKLLHRLVYVAAYLILLHALSLGTHFSDLSSALPHVFFIAIGFLLVLEGLRIDAWLARRFTIFTKWKQSTIIVLFLIVHFYSSNMQPGTQNSFSVHSQHTGFTNNSSEAVKKYDGLFAHHDTVVAGVETVLIFAVEDENGNPVSSFDVLNEKLAHLIIVNDSLDYFVHLHPTFKDMRFTQTTTFPAEGRYHLYLDVDPADVIEQQFSFELVVGNPPESKAQVDTTNQALTKQVNGYEVSLATNEPLVASRMSAGLQRLSFTLKESDTGQPVASLEPYLGSYGHLVMIHTKTYAYIHVHPALSAAPGNKGGPTVTFIPLSLTEDIAPGTYRLFVEFAPLGKLIMVDYTVEVK